MRSAGETDSQCATLASIAFGALPSSAACKCRFCGIRLRLSGPDRAKINLFANCNLGSLSLHSPITLAKENYLAEKTHLIQTNLDGLYINCGFDLNLPVDLIDIIIGRKAKSVDAGTVLVPLVRGGALGQGYERHA